MSLTLWLTLRCFFGSTRVTLLDTNADGFITKQEWHTGWRNGEFDIEVPGTGGNPQNPLGRVVSRHLTRSNLEGPSIKRDKKSSAPASAPAAASKKSQKGGKVRIADVNGDAPAP